LTPQQRRGGCGGGGGGGAARENTLAFGQGRIREAAAARRGVCVTLKSPNRFTISSWSVCYAGNEIGNSARR